MKKKVILIAVGMAVVLVGGTIYGCASGFGAVKVRTVSAERKSVSDSYTEDGSISLGDSCKIISEVSGPVEEVVVSKNQPVKKGDVLYRIGTEDYSYELETLKAELSGYEARLEKAKVGNVMTLSPEEYLEDLRKQKESAEAALSAAASTYTAYSSLFSTGDVSKTDYDRARAEYENAESEVQSAGSRYIEASRYLGQLEKEGMSKADIRKVFYESDSDAMEASINSAKAQIDKLSSKIDKCTVKAQEDGIVSELPVKNMTLVSAGQETAEIKTQSSPKVESDVLTSIVPYLHIGDGVDIKLSLRGKDEVYKGVISEIYDYADKGTSALGTDEYRVHVVMELGGTKGGSDTGGAGSTGQWTGADNASSGQNLSGEKLKGREGYGVNVTFPLYEAQDVLTVPASSVFDSGDRDYVYTINDGKAVKTEIAVEYRTASDVVVKSGIAVGEKVIERADDEEIYDGVRVKG
ncbi:efflux RND transporter periplasmic adaptor subunit [Oribacterium sp. C9]|uniref:efflux RND transporter periplasmic adaptor subunit n=1 Tax=Oribacterium sp. C9 TaxID=1943579 RepID=UPI00143C46C2|nr:biotin/lipoyl-binding protein [Oribacterium sp. C9]